MKFYINRVISRIIPLIMLFVAMQILQSCESDDDKSTNWVDLRYRANDAYTIEAKSPTPIIIQVKSTRSWEVCGKEDWYTISPAVGGAGEAYDVTILCHENITANERVGKIYIKSDYWTGKELTITQKGNTTVTP